MKIVWTCDDCGKDASDGVFWVNYQDIVTHAKWRDPNEGKVITARDLLENPGPEVGGWIYRCGTCCMRSDDVPEPALSMSVAHYQDIDDFQFVLGHFLGKPDVAMHSDLPKRLKDSRQRPWRFVDAA